MEILIYEEISGLKALKEKGINSQKIKETVVHFVIGESRVLPTYWHVAQKIEKDKKLKKKIFKLKKKKIVRNEDLTSMHFSKSSDKMS